MESGNLELVVLTAAAFEQQTLRESLGGLELTVISQRQVMLGQILGKKTALVETGIGAVNTAQALTVVIENLGASCVLQIGIGGAFPSSQLAIGDLAVAAEEIHGEFGVIEADGWSDGETIGIPQINGDPPIYNRIPMDDSACKSAQAAAREAALDLGCRVESGAFLTVQNVTGTDDQAGLLDTRFAPLCENMEGAAAAQVCCLYGVPFAEIRGISNIVGARDLSKWKIPAASAAAQSAALAFIRTL